MTTIGYCISCKQTDCPTPSVKDKAGANCSFWTSGQPEPAGKAVNNDPAADCFKGIPDRGTYLTRRLNQCPKCSGHMDTLTCNECGYHFELEAA